MQALATRRTRTTPPIRAADATVYLVPSAPVLAPRRQHLNPALCNHEHAIRPARTNGAGLHGGDLLVSTITPRSSTVHPPWKGTTMRHPLLNRRPHALPMSRTARCWLAAACTLAAMACPWAHAQVVRCIDPQSGHLTYTDGQCAKGQSGIEIERAHSAGEVAQAQERAVAARERWQSEQLRQLKLAPPVVAPPPLTAEQQRARGCEQSRIQLQQLSASNADLPTLNAARTAMEMQCLGPEGYAALESSRSNTVITHSGIAPMPSHMPLWNRPWPRPPMGHSGCQGGNCGGPQGAATMPAPAAPPRWTVGPQRLGPSTGSGR